MYYDDEFWPDHDANGPDDTFSDPYDDECDDWDEEQAEEMRRHEFLERMRDRAYESYPQGEKVSYCPMCGEPLVFNSMDYRVGEHIDSCE